MSETDYSSRIGKMTWSYSRIDSFEPCRYKWFLRYIDDPLGVKGKPMFYSSYGTFMHRLIERYYRGELSKDDMVLEFLTDFEDMVKGERPSNDIVHRYIQSGVAYLKSFKPFPYNVVDVEKKVTFKAMGHKFVGIIDYLGEKDGELYIVDNKSRDLKPRSKRKKPTLKDQELDAMLRQLYLYSVAIKQEYGKYPKALCFNCFKNGTFIEEPFDVVAYDAALRWADETIKKITNTKSFYPSIDFFFCKYLCDYSDECCYVGGGEDES